MSPFELFLDAKLALCNSPEWDLEGTMTYPQPIHLAHSFLSRAESHLGIRATEGYAPGESVTKGLVHVLDFGIVQIDEVLF